MAFPLKGEGQGGRRFWGTPQPIPCFLLPSPHSTPYKGHIPSPPLTLYLPTFTFSDFSFLRTVSDIHVCPVLLVRVGTYLPCPSSFHASSSSELRITTVPTHSKRLSFLRRPANFGTLPLKAYLITPLSFRRLLPIEWGKVMPFQLEKLIKHPITCNLLYINDVKTEKKIIKSLLSKVTFLCPFTHCKKGSSKGKRS